MKWLIIIFITLSCSACSDRIGNTLKQVDESEHLNEHLRTFKFQGKSQDSILIDSIIVDSVGC